MRTFDNLQHESDKEKDNSSLGGVSKCYIVLFEDGHYYGSFSPLAVYENRKSAENAARKWKKANPSEQVVVEEVDYNAY